MTDTPVFEVRDIRKDYVLGKPGLFGGKLRSLAAVRDVSFTLRRGETVGLVGESGCGKSSLARTVLRLNEPTGGEVRYHGRNILDLPKAEMQKLRRHIQVVFQDPYSSLDPRFTVRRILSEPWQVFPDIVPPARREARVAELLTLVGLNPSDADRYPHQFSGGQRQRIGIARALVGAGVVKGARVAVHMANRPEWAEAAFAVGMIGAVLVPVNPSRKVGSQTKIATSQAT
ncbi:ATP-binding cassette domain-containing protein [Marinovum algicola]|uniref:ATP-binding cassette domain-containing protein n=1 Tax=Marinovum algicola TaxID=42444 RepID=UPI0024B9772F|nr:ATP-binding cassette domain-containing protein [Marinovum algicola]